MRERVQLIRVSHPYLGSYEADLVSTNDADKQGYAVYLPVSEDDMPLETGERVILKWDDEVNKRGRGVVESIDVEDHQEHESDWQTLKISVAIKDHNSNLRHYPRLLGGFEFLYASLDEIDNVEEWLSNRIESISIRSDSRFSQPKDELINFSVSGFSFESEHPIDNSTPLVCAVGVESTTELIRCLAKVVRCQKNEEIYEVAVHFISPPQRLINALSEFTLKLQRQQTEGLQYEV
jgi:hypothetical protein